MGPVTDLISRLDSFASGKDAIQIPASPLQANRLPPLENQREAAQQVAEELLALQSIFAEESVQLLEIKSPENNGMNTHLPSHSRPGTPAAAEALSLDAAQWTPDMSIRLSISTSIDSPIDGQEAPSLRLSATLPPCYPLANVPPQLQLLNRYIGARGVDHSLFGDVLRTYMHKGEHGWSPGEVALFDGIERVRETTSKWYGEKESERIARSLADDAHGPPHNQDDGEEHRGVTTFQAQDEESLHHSPPQAFSKVQLTRSPAITERKSVFVGHAARINGPSDVPAILSDLLQDRKIARATHPSIHAWICGSSHHGPVHRDCDDDGETAAGGRLAHLLDLLRLENVIVIVTRWYGGVLLGPDRFKLINRAARDALEVAGLVEGPLNPNGIATKGGAGPNLHKSKGGNKK